MRRRELSVRRVRPLLLLLRKNAAPRASPRAGSESGVSPEKPPQTPPGNSTRTLAYVFGGVGVLAMGGFAYFGLAGMHEKHELDACKPYCDSSRVDSARLKLTLADVALGVGIASLGAAVWLYVASRESDAGRTRVGIGVLPAGVVVAAASVF